MRENRRFFSFVGYVFFVLGLIVLSIAMVNAAINIRFFLKAEETQAYIENIESSGDTHNVYVSYEVKGVSYTGISLGYYSSEMDEARHLKIKYDPDEPSNIRAKDGWFIIILMPLLLGVCCTAYGGYETFVSYRFYKKRRLRDTGRCYKLPIIEIIADYHNRRNKIPACSVICQGENSDMENCQVYLSDNYYERGFEERYHVGDIVPVYIDRTNLGNYFVDVENVEEQNCVEK